MRHYAFFILTMGAKTYGIRRMGIVLTLLLWAVLPLRGQVNICYDFESSVPNSRPVGWGALPNLDYHYVGISSDIAHTGGKSLCNNGTTCYTLMPDEGINYGADGVWLTFWYYTHLNTDYFDVGYLTDATDATTFHQLATAHDWGQEWHFLAVNLSSVPTGARIAFFGHDLMSADGTFWIDDIQLTSSPCAAWRLRVAENRADSVCLRWFTAGLPTVTLTINGTPYTVTGNSFTFARNPATTYHASLIAACPSTGCIPIQPYSEVTVYPYREGTCLDVTDFGSAMATPFYGTWLAPSLHMGTYTTTRPGVTGVFAGSHTLNTNPGSDGGGMMVFPRTIPPGDNATLRLGNRLGDWEAAEMFYTLTVDTNVNNLLVVKYTVAMACGSMTTTDIVAHNDSLYPAWFRIELLDEHLASLGGPICNQFYLDMWDTAGWDEVNSMYKRRDFSGMAFDLSPYHGRRIHLRVTTCDGAVNNRWCYGYYNFECLKRYDDSYNCLADSLTFTMPYGFRYRWRRDGDTTTLSNAQSITVATDSTLYHCELANRFNPSCRTLVSRRALPRPQRWATDTVVENDLPTTFMGVTFTAAADTTFVLPSASGCDTLLHYRLHVWSNQQVRLERPVCKGDWPIVWEGYTFDAPDSVTFTLPDSHGADSTVTLVAVEVPVYEVYDTLVICPGMPFVYDGVDYGGPTVIDTLLQSQAGCDSTVHLSLVARDTAFRLAAYYSTDRQRWYNASPIVLCVGQTLWLRDSTDGTTAWSWTLAGLEAQGREASLVPNTPLQGDTLTLVATSGGGCTDTLQWPVFVLTRPATAFSWTPEAPVDVAPEVQFINLTQPDSCLYHWWIRNGEGLDTLTGRAPFYRWPGELPTGSFDVTLLASSDTSFLFLDSVITHTCVDSTTRAVEIVTAWLQFPNLVTPNGDGVNDRWEIVNLVELGQYTMNELWIYNSWGVLVFHAKDIRREEDFWNPADTHSPDGTYYYRFSTKGLHGLIRCNGIIEVIR